MSCSETRSLLALRSFSLLEDEERASVEAHLASCPACRLEVAAHDEVAAALGSSRQDERPPERVWEALAPKLGAAPAAEIAPRRPLLDLACAGCQGGLEDAVYCASCLAPHHPSCFTLCGVRGCKGTKVVSARRPRGSYSLPLVVVGIAAIGAIAFVQRGYDEQKSVYEQLVEESRRNTQLEADLRKLIASRAVAPAQHAEKAAPPSPDRVTLRCEDEELASVVDRIGQECQRNIVLDPSARGKVTLRLKDVDWRDAVSAIAQLARCEVREEGNVTVLARPIPPLEPAPVGHAEVILPRPADTAPEWPPLKLSGVVATNERLSSTAVIKLGSGPDRFYRERDELLGRDGKSFAPRIFLVEIGHDKVEIARGSLDGPRTTLTIGP